MRRKSSRGSIRPSRRAGKLSARVLELENALKRLEVALRALEIGKQVRLYVSEGREGVRLDVSQDKG